MPGAPASRERGSGNAFPVLFCREIDLGEALRHNESNNSVQEEMVAETDFDRIRKQVRQFVVERDWDQFHSPKNLSMALIVEAAELVEHFQWLTEEQSGKLSPEKLAEVELELADIQIYLISLAEKLQLDLVAAAEKKLALNAKKYPADKARGNSKKYTELDDESGDPSMSR
jgi:NTP pyrophosphatase (non-canonical NTP hydrolase)